MMFQSCFRECCTWVLRMLPTESMLFLRKKESTCHSSALQLSPAFPLVDSGVRWLELRLKGFLCRR